MTHRLWPLFDLRIRTPRLELRLPTDDDLVAQMEIVDSGIHNRDMLPFNIDWVGRSSPERERGYIQHHWGARASWTPEAWNLMLSVFVDGQVIGSQTVFAEDFPRLGAVTTGSWLGRRYQRKGYGLEMRAAVLELAFVGLGAVEARSTARDTNAASLGVSRRLGYEPNGVIRRVMSDQIALQHQLLLTRDRWQANRPAIDISIEGLESSLDLFGVNPETSE